jgi:hypothetical protein
MAAGAGPLQTPFERTGAPDYARRPDVAVYALTLQLPLEGKLARGGIVGVIKTAGERWLHAQLHGSFPDFYISTREVAALLQRLALPAAHMHAQSICAYIAALAARAVVAQLIHLPVSVVLSRHCT